MRSILFIIGTLLVSSTWAQTCDTVSISGPSGDAPASWVLDGELIGAGVELAQITLKAAGVKNVKIVRFPTWAESLAAVRAGEVDMIISAGWSSDRARYLTYVYPAYAYQFLFVIVRRGEQFQLNQYADLKGRRGVAGAGVTFGDSTFGTFVEKELNLSRSPGLEESFRRLLAREVDYILAYEDSASSEIYRRDIGDKVQVLATYPFRIDTFFAFSKRSKCATLLKEKVGHEIEKARKKNQYFMLLKKYRSIFNESQPPMPAPMPTSTSTSTPTPTSTSTAK
jgi:polar amino acid transport system substrate-binding protein